MLRYYFDINIFFEVQRSEIYRNDHAPPQFANRVPPTKRKEPRDENPA
jgi:hypothetical protein